MTETTSLVALWCWYHGGPFRGYQSQLEGPTVQDTMRAALQRAGFSRNPTACSRTDLGVHARMQVLSMRVLSGEPLSELAPRVNAELDHRLGVACVRPAPRKFNAAWSATGKEYRYRLSTLAHPDWQGCAWQVAVAPERLEALAPLLEGTRDFSAFHDPASTVKPRTIRSARLHRLGDGLMEVRIRGDAFGRYMVRTLVGALVDVASGERSVGELEAGLTEGRRFRPTRAPPQGLILWEVEYAAGVDPFAADRLAPPALPAQPPFVSTT
jgi:tRNA pseudouridine38-40 synthase